MSLKEQTRAAMSLSELLNGICPATGLPDLAPRGLCLDSRAVKQGDLFLAVAGHQRHGLQYHSDAIDRGACAILYDPAGGGQTFASDIRRLSCIPVEALHTKVGYIADRFFGHPSANLDVMAVTGTNGKTSCTHFLANALDDGHPAAVIGTLGWGAPGHLMKTEQTTPNAIEVHAILDDLRRNSTRAVAIEASSHGLVQGRLNGVRPKAALFTNVTRDHLDYHGTQEAYVAAKMSLLEFPGLETVAFNADDEITRLIADRLPKGVEGIAFSAGGHVVPGVRTVVARRIDQTVDGLCMLVDDQGRDAELRAPVFGDYNAENILGSLAVLLGLGYGFNDAVERLGKVRPVPGRMEHFRGADGLSVVVDYAHTPDALEGVLRSLKAHCAGQLWVVFGCGGERDRGKRPMMGRIAETWADHVVVTDDNPRDEDGNGIVADILAGCSGGNVRVERDRLEAIRLAIESADPDDIVLVAGKGHEPFQDVNGVKRPFDDRVIARSLLQNIGAVT